MNYIRVPDKEKQYRAIGSSLGYLTLEGETKELRIKEYGTEQAYKVSFSPGFGQWLNKSKFEVFDRIFRFKFWVRQKKGRVTLTIIGLDPANLADFEQAENSSTVSLRGKLHCWDLKTGTFKLIIKRNSQPSSKAVTLKTAWLWRPHKIVVNGVLDRPARGQFWEIECRIGARQLVCTQARLVAEAKKPAQKIPNRDFKPLLKNRA